MSRASKGKLRYIRELYKNYVSPHHTLMTENNIVLYQDIFPELKLKVGDRFQVKTRRWPKAAITVMDSYKSRSWRFT